MAQTQIRLSRQALDLSLTTAKIADLAVTTAKINDLAVTSAKLAGGAVLVDKLSDFRPTDGGMLNLAIAAGTVRNDNIVNSYAGGTEALTDNATNYVEVSSGGTVSHNTSGFTAGKFPIAVVITASGVISSLTDKRAWALATSGERDNFIIREIPTGTINGINDTFTLAQTPVAGSEEVFLNGILQQSGGQDYTITGSTIVFEAGSIPQTNDRLLVSYRY